MKSIPARKQSTDDAEGIALIPAEVFEDKLKNTWEYASKKIEDND